MNKCKHIKCDKEVVNGEKYCKYHQQKNEGRKKFALQLVCGVGAFGLAIIKKTSSKKF